MISIDVTALIISALVFGLVFVLKNTFFEPLAQAMETRQGRIDRAATAWDDAQQTIDEARSDVAAAVQSTRNEGYRLLDEAALAAVKQWRFAPSTPSATNLKRASVTLTVLRERSRCTQAST